MSAAWPDDLADKVRQAYIVEGLSATQTALRLGKGITRAAVIGLANRRGWKKTNGGMGGRQAPSNPNAFVTVNPAPVVESPTARRFGEKYPATDSARLLVDLGPGQCKWPVGVPDQPGDQLFCAGRASEGVYCPAHRKRAYQPKATACAS